MRPFLIVLTLCPAAALADVPRVVTDIAPVHSLAAMAMQGLGEPALLVPSGASPHGFALRPSDARALEAAGLVILNGGGLAPAAERAAAELAPGATRIDLMALEPTHRLPAREGAALEAHDHDGDREGRGGDDHDVEHHEAHGDEDHGDEDHRRGAHDDHAGDDFDPHGWLDPANAKVWLVTIAAALAEVDPGNADRYAANAEAGAEQIDAAAQAAREVLSPVAAAPFLVAHDSLAYFEDAFGLTAAGAVAGLDAAAPGPRRVEAARAALEGSGAACVFTEVGEPSPLAERVAEGTAARLVEIDPLGARLDPGPGLYPALLERLAADMAACLGG